MHLIPTKVNENCAWIQERQDPFVYSKREFFSHTYNYFDRVLAFKHIIASFPQRYLVFPPCRRNKHMGGKIAMLLWKELNGLPKSRLLL